MMSLVRERQRITGQRTVGIWWLVLGGLDLGLFILNLASDDFRPGLLVTLGTSVVFLVIGVRCVRAARRALAAFESEHGVDAGVQQPIR